MGIDLKLESLHQRPSQIPLFGVTVSSLLVYLAMITLTSSRSRLIPFDFYLSKVPVSFDLFDIILWRLFNDGDGRLRFSHRLQSCNSSI